MARSAIAGDYLQRLITIGLDALGRVLVVVYTWRDREIRLISARSATRQERRQYGVGAVYGSPDLAIRS
nr:BrnT family toxin [Chamaesiphon sp. OTE_8_metabat_110]